ncbi:MAG: cytochrome C oxidase subunit IV family protein [Phycisphaerales bacterium]|nr:cytochrome C oxidase subunit IV family protein [Phycisphaerales bacterium]MCB9854269.1 cytochrome C oxidase subunit IV family protein [Phycisphaerales bacterium]
MGSSAHEIQGHLKKYYMVFGALLVLTGVTVAVAEFHVSIGMAIVVALFVASIKGTLVACYFMHLMEEKSMLIWILALCALFFLMLLLVPMFTIGEQDAGLMERMRGLSPN